MFQDCFFSNVYQKGVVIIIGGLSNALYLLEGPLGNKVKSLSV